MSEPATQANPDRWKLPALACALFAVDPAGLQGVVLRAGPGPVRDCWLRQLRELLPAGMPWRRMPAHIRDDRLLGGLDLSATLRAGRPVVEPGLLAESHGGVLLIAMAERLEAATAARLATVLDRGEVAVERAGVSSRAPARLGMIALDEGIGEEEAAPVSLIDRFAICLQLDGIRLEDTSAPSADKSAIAAARQRLAGVRISQELIAALCATAAQLGIDSPRVAALAVRAARVAAALQGERQVAEDHAALAAQLVFACRAAQLPEAEQEVEAEEEPQAPEEAPESGEAEAEPQAPEETDDISDPKALRDQVLEAARAAIPPDLLARLRHANQRANSTRSSARSLARRRPAKRGRRIGVRPGEPGAGNVLNLVETLRTAAPWQALRKTRHKAGAASRSPAASAPVVSLRRDDFRINRYQQRSATTTVFAVDASGSAALHRLAEAKGAVELLLAESYQRRDQVALVAFRGQVAELLLPPTRSLVRAKRSLAGLPGGGGTPLAAGIHLALETALGIRRKGETPVLIFLTDGRANVALDGEPDRPRAGDEALAAARAVRAEEVATLLVDTSPRPRQVARQLAEAMAAAYLALPHAGAEALSGAARAAGSGPASRRQPA
ncbi:MAG: magnesium chelatase subunit D [Gammaproteobacteria bacterium]|nr:magnesium chelatase subunit D [Gammaproteobacteria bacterium]